MYASRLILLVQAIALTALLSACQPTQPAEDKVLVELAAVTAQIEQLQTQLAGTEESLDHLGQARVDSDRTIGDRIDKTYSELRALPALIERACERPTTVVTECDDTQEVTTILIQDDKFVVGELEHVWLDPPGIMLPARVDTGASRNSLHALKLKRFERDGDRWVRFDVVTSDGPITLERRIVRFVRVVQQSDPEGSRRPVVNMRVHMGTHEGTFEFTLADRSHLEYEILLGRNFLKDIAVVDVSRQFVQPMPVGADGQAGGK